MLAKPHIMKPDISNMPVSCEDCNNKDNAFSCLSRSEKSDLAKDKGRNFYKKGQVIFYEGNHPHGLYCIYKGKVKISKLGDEGKDQIIRLAGDADMLGYRALLSNEPYKATATAIEDSYICYLSKRQYFDMMSKNTSLCMSTVKILASDLKDSEQQLIDISQRTVKERIADTLLTITEKFGYKEDNVTIDVKLTRRELGDMAGVTTETTIRTLSELNKSKIINLVGKEIQIIDPQKLKNITSTF